MARRVMLQPAAGPSPLLQNAPLPSQKTWTDMMSRLKKKYGKRKKRTIQPANKKKAYQAKLRAMILPTIQPANKKKAYQAKLRAMTLPTIQPANKKKTYQAKLRAMTLPTKTEQKAYQAKLRGMTLPARRGKERTTSLDLSLLNVVQAFPGANKILKVYPNRSSLNSLVNRMPGAKKKVATFLKM